MSRGLRLWSEPFRPTGGVAAHGVINALGRPELDFLELFVRETVQNSWDARNADGPISFTLKGWQLRGRPLSTLREAVFAERPAEGLTLNETLSQDPLPVLAVSDRGTAGLGGPTRADVVTDGPRDFVEFFRNVGAEPDKEFGGGTYGYGKSVLYLMSSARTILAYTRCLDRGRPVSRLMAAALGRAFRRRVHGRPAPFTGRHWWGVLDRAVGVDPLAGAAADGLAHRLGLPGFADGELGTTILMIGAVLGDEPKAAIQAMAEAVLWHCWPKMTASPEREPSIRFSLGWEDEDIPVPDPDGHPELREFARALRVTRADDARASGGIDIRPIECLRPRQRLGRLGLVQFVSPPAIGAHPPLGRPEGPSLHHVALLRQPELVVKYLPGPESPVPGAAWGGVFLADATVDRAFATAEPPTHDDWAPGILGRSWGKTFVTVGLREIRNALNLFAAPPPPPDDRVAVPMAAFANALSGLLARDKGPGTSILVPPRGGFSRTHGNDGRPGGDGVDGAADGPSGGTGSERHPRPRLLLIGGPRLTLFDRRPAVAVDFSVRQSQGARPARVSVTTAAAVNEGATVEKDPPLDADRPEVLAWLIGTEVERRCTGTLEVRAGDDRVRTVVVSVPSDTAVAVSLACAPGAS